MTRKQENSHSRIPKFNTPEEAGTFWDTHSPEDFPEEFEEVQVKFSRPLINRGLTIKLTDETIEQLRKVAQNRGIGPSTLARMWILEHLRETTSKTAPSDSR